MAKNGFSMSNRVAVETITADKTLTADDCGKVFVVTSAPNGASVEIIVPDPVAAGLGWNCELVFESGSSAAANQDVIVSSSAGTAAGPFKVRYLTTAAASANSGVAGAANAITHSAGTQQTGDLIKIVNVSASIGGYFWSVDAVTSGALS